MMTIIARRAVAEIGGDARVFTCRITSEARRLAEMRPACDRMREAFLD